MRMLCLHRIQIVIIKLFSQTRLYNVYSVKSLQPTKMNLTDTLDQAPNFTDEPIDRLLFTFLFDI